MSLGSLAFLDSNMSGIGEYAMHCLRQIVLFFSLTMNVLNRLCLSVLCAAVLVSALSCPQVSPFPALSHSHLRNRLSVLVKTNDATPQVRQVHLLAFSNNLLLQLEEHVPTIWSVVSTIFADNTGQEISVHLAMTVLTALMGRRCYASTSDVVTVEELGERSPTQHPQTDWIVRVGLPCCSNRDCGIYGNCSNGICRGLPYVIRKRAIMYPLSRCPLEWVHHALATMRDVTSVSSAM